jgi:enterochelin esterase-like enzyme
MAVAVLAGPTASQATALRGSVSYASFRSTALGGTVHYAVYLPPDYVLTPERYPVVYFLHGLPAGSDAYKAIGSVAQALEQDGDRAIVIGVQGARDGDTDPEYLDHGPGRNWETAVTKELVSVVDARYRTIASRAGRAIVGISAGGYGAMLIALHHPGLYSAVESWSGYFHATTPDGTASLELGSAAADARADAREQLAAMRALVRAHTYVAFYVGTQDTLFRAENVQFHATLQKAGIKHVFALYSGGHNWTLWNAHAAAWLHAALVRR